jgi:hypothetical protein
MILKHSIDRHSLLACTFWILAACSIPALLSVQTPPAGWDLHVYANAVRALRAGADPYLNGIAVQRAMHAEMLAHPERMPPYTYVYSPITLPLLRLIALMPLYPAGVLYWIADVLGMLVMVRATMEALKPEERKPFLLLAPAALFFPGLLQTNVFFSGNLSYVLYGLMLAAAVQGWRRADWTWFYLATLAASCFKAPRLTLLLIPVLSLRRQWLPACLTAVAGLAIFALQPLFWPDLMRHYLQAVSLQFSYNHDFGFSLAGLAGSALFALGRPYSTASSVIYVLYALPLLGLLIYLSRRYVAGDFSLEAWIPVMLVGVVLLNPRIKEYDVAPLTIPLALIAWRFFSPGNTLRAAVWKMALFFGAINAVAFISMTVWRTLDGILLITLFLVGSWQLWRLKPRFAMSSVPENIGANRAGETSY